MIVENLEIKNLEFKPIKDMLKVRLVDTEDNVYTIFEYSNSLKNNSHTSSSIFQNGAFTQDSEGNLTNVFFAENIAQKIFNKLKEEFA